MDNELFDLCKQVYEKTGWKDTFAVYEQTDGIPLGTPYVSYPELERKYGLWSTQEMKKQTPLYTTDYLLEKLPSVVQDTDDKIFRVITMWINGDGSTHAGYAEPYAHDDKYAHSQTSDKMVDTLLKLTLELSEDGKL